MYNELELWPTVKLVLMWTGMVVGGIVTLGCIGGALSAIVQGRANPFGKGKSEFWLPLLIGLMFAGVVYFCVHRTFLAEPKTEEQQEPEETPQGAPGPSKADLGRIVPDGRAARDSAFDRSNLVFPREQAT